MSRKPRLRARLAWLNNQYIAFGVVWSPASIATEGHSDSWDERRSVWQKAVVPGQADKGSRVMETPDMDGMVAQSIAEGRQGRWYTGTSWTY